MLSSPPTGTGTVFQGGTRPESEPTLKVSQPPLDDSPGDGGRKLAPKILAAPRGAPRAAASVLAGGARSVCPAPISGAACSTSRPRSCPTWRCRSRCTCRSRSLLPAGARDRDPRGRVSSCGRSSSSTTARTARSCRPSAPTPGSASSWGCSSTRPFLRWRHDHAIHHATSGDLDRRGGGDVRTLTVAEYRALLAAGAPRLPPVPQPARDVRDRADLRAAHRPAHRGAQCAPAHAPQRDRHQHRPRA